MVTKKVFRNIADWECYRNSQFWLGSSNIGTILGLNEHQTPLMLWQSVKGATAAETPETTRRLHRGHFMENSIAEWFAAESGLSIVKKSAEISVYTNEKYPDYMQVAPDREIFASSVGTQRRAVLEIKDTARHINFDDPKGLPAEWFAQVQFQMAIMERDCAYLAINDGRKCLQYRRIDFDADYADAIIAEAKEWVEKYIIGDEQPEPSNGDDVMSLYPQSEAGVVKVGKTAFEALEACREYRRQAKELESKIDALNEQIKAYFDTRDTLEYDGATIATYKTVKSNRFDSKAFAEAYPELYAKFIVSSSTRRLTM